MSEKKKLTGLPPVDRESQGIELIETLKKAYTCSKCGERGRVVSNSLGVNVFCNTCKIHWPISAMPRSPDPIPNPGRGLRKETYVEPDWDKAFESDSMELNNEQIGPKRRG